jgi:hypothetical protein
MQRPCEICNQPIEPERAEAVPETRLCAAHGREIEKYGGEFRVTASWERTSKVGSLKRNYGGVTPQKTRNQQALERLRADWLETHPGKPSCQSPQS